MIIRDLDNIAYCVSKLPLVNAAQLVGSLDGTAFGSMYNWSEFFNDKMIKKALKGITQMHHFKFHSSSPGTVFVKTSSSAEKNGQSN